MDIISKLNIVSDIIVTDEEAELFVNKPFVLEQLPFVDPLLINDKYLTIETPETMLDYFKDLLNTDDSDMRVSVLNGLHIEQDTSCYYCDYCETKINDDWFYCYHCNKDMCNMCYEETSEEVALKNGAQNYKKREEALNKCRSCKQIEPRNIYNIIPPRYRQCDLCNNDIESSNFYSTRELDDTYDICAECYQNSNDARNMVETKSMQLIDVNDKSNYYFGHTGFGSMLYWFPIISDTEGCHVFMNLNPDDINYGKICLQSCDDHERFGYFIIRDEKYDLQKVLERLKEICDKGTFEYEDYEEVEEGVYGEEIVTKHDDGWTTTKRETIKEPKYEWVTITAELCSKHHSSPIHILMKELNMPVYYG